MTNKNIIIIILLMSPICVSGYPLLGASQTLSCTGSVQQYTVPSDATTLLVYMWGAGGGGDTSNSAAGGAGAYVEGILSVTGGQNLDIIVGCKGIKTGAGGYGGGGTGSSCAGGGGRSAIRTTGASLDLVTAGGKYNSCVIFRLYII